MSNSWEPRDENKQRFNEIDEAIQQEERLWRARRLVRSGVVPDMLRISQRFDALLDQLIEAELIDRDELNIQAMIKELTLMRNIRATAEEQSIKSQIIMPGGSH